MTDSEHLIGSKRLAELLDCDRRTAAAILNVIGDVEITPGTMRLTQEAYDNWLKERKNGDVARKEEALGGEAPDQSGRWKYPSA